MLIFRAKIALNAVICMILFLSFLDNGVMTTPKHQILSLVFTVLCFKQSLVVFVTEIKQHKVSNHRTTAKLLMNNFIYM